MINVKEFRLGNLFILEGKAYSVEGICQYTHRLISKDGEEYFIVNNPNPIPLTPEWLEKFGYKKDSLDNKWYKSPHHMPPIYNWRKGDFGMDGLPLIAKSIQFVHQLQNLYFALTGEELTINNEHLQSTS